MGSFLFFEIINNFYQKKKYKFYFLFLMSLIAGLFEYMGLILIFQFVLFLSNPETKYCQNIIEFFQNTFNVFEYSKIALILGVTVAFIYIIKNIYMLIFTKFNNGILEDLSVNITLKTLKNLLFQDYLTTNKISFERKMNILSKNELVVWGYCYKFINLISNCAIALILILFLFVKFTLSAVVAVVFISVLSFVEYLYLKNKSNYQDKHFSSCFDSLNSILIKTIKSIKEIKLNNKQEYFIEENSKFAKEYATLNKDRNFCTIFHIYFTEISIMFAFILVLSTLFYTTKFDNQLLITSISTICVIILRLTPVINRAQSCLYSINAHKTLAQDLIEFDNIFDKNIKFSSSDEILPFEKNIKLNEVNFSYGEDIGLKDINLEIKKNEFIGIVGKSGCYKTTLSLIIAGLIKPCSGEILVDNNILKGDEYQKWQNNIALLSQDYSILFDDIAEVDEKYIEKLGLKNINKDLNNLSCGEKQRIALANILSQNKNVLILDEITSSSDVISQQNVNKILSDLKGKKTIVSIAHRLQVLKNCDRVIFMQEGKISDIDTFKALNDKHEEFRKIVELSNFELD